MATISIKNLGFQPIVEKKSGEKSTFFSKGDTYFGEYQPYRQNFNFSTFFCNKQLIEKNVKTVSFTRVFPAHDFGNRQTYKITNTGVDGPCPYYKIKNIAFEQTRN